MIYGVGSSHSLSSPGFTRHLFFEQSGRENKQLSKLYSNRLGQDLNLGVLIHSKLDITIIPEVLYKMNEKCNNEKLFTTVVKANAFQSLHFSGHNIWVSDRQ